MINLRIGFVGVGAMGGALLEGMLQAGVIEPENLFAADPAEEQRTAVAASIGPEHVFADNADLVDACDVVVLAVKPHVVPAVAEDIGEELEPRQLVVSIAAGVTLQVLREALGTRRLVRVMPNTPASVGRGAAGFCPSADATEQDADLVAQMLGAVGLCVRVDDEDLMDAVTGLSGSGPAYVYLVIEALTRGGVEAGLAEEDAAKLAAQTVLGAARMVLETGRDPAVLRDKVTTPGGTTEQGLRVLEERDVRDAFAQAVAAATEKSRRLAE